MPAVLARRPGANLVIVGDGAAADSLRALADSLDLAKNVTFTGRLPNAELASRYGSARMCVIPSVWMENSPLVAYEAMAAGRPIVGSDRGGITDLVESGRCGFVVPACDPAALAERILALLEDPKLAAELGENGRRHVTEALSAEAFVRNLDVVLREARSTGLAAEAGAPAP